MAVTLLHLTDLHIRSEQDSVLQQAESIAASTYRHVVDAEALFIVISGDIAFSGEVEQYSLAFNFLKKIEKSIAEQNPECKINFVVCPGNHDCDFSLDSQPRKVLIKHFQIDPGTYIDDESIGLCTRVQAPYFDFASRLMGGESERCRKLCSTYSFSVTNCTICFDIINVSWCSSINEQVGKLTFPIERYRECLDSGENNGEKVYRIAVLHHPFNWLGQDVYRPLRNEIRKNSCFVFTGHEHEANEGQVSETASGQSAFLEGRLLFSNEYGLEDSGFSVSEIDFQKRIYLCTQYVWGDGAYQRDERLGPPEDKAFPKSDVAQFEISGAFLSSLNDPGMFLRHPSGKSITLSNLFVYPDLMAVNAGESDEIAINSDRLLKEAVRPSCILISSDEKAGSSSLLKKLFLDARQSGLVPVLISGSSIHSKSKAHLENLIEEAVNRQYDKSSVSNGLMALPKERRVLLLDDIERSQVKSQKSINAILKHFQDRFDVIVVTSDEFFEFRDMVSLSSDEVVGKFECFKIKEFGHAKRLELISKWVSVGGQYDLSDEDRIARISEAESLVNAVVKRMLVPSVPFYLTILLQGAEAGRARDLKDGGLGFYYEHLLTEALKEAEIPREKYLEYYEYCSRLAWQFYRIQRDVLDHDEFRRFNSDFSREIHTVDLESRISKLRRARILEDTGSGIKFKYPYLYFYFKSRYMFSNISNSEIRTYLDDCCKNLYVRECANTVLFICHHASDGFIIDNIVRTLASLFNQYEIVKFDSPRRELDDLMNNAPRLAYQAKDPEEARIQKSKVLDGLPTSDGLMDEPEANSILSIPAQLTMLFKTIEILGQILKTQYAKIPRSRRVELIDEIFRGPLRALRSFYDLIQSNPEILVKEISKKFAKEELEISDIEAQNTARKIVASLIELITFSFVFKAAKCVSCESLDEDIVSVSESNKSNAFRLLHLAHRMDSPKPMPRGLIEELSRGVAMNIIPSRVMKLLILQRLYMFRTSESDMRWLQGHADIDLVSQHRLAYQREDTKKN